MGSVNTKRKRHQVVNIGTSFMVVILIGLSFAVVAALAISSARNDYRLSSQLAEHTKDYYEASNEAMEIIDGSYWKDQVFEVNLGENQVLSVEVKNNTITKWQVENVASWEAEDSLPVFQ